MDQKEKIELLISSIKKTTNYLNNLTKHSNSISDDLKEGLELQKDTLNLAVMLVECGTDVKEVA